MSLAYVDTSVWIASAEGLLSYKKIILQNLLELQERNWEFCISDAVILEVLTKPGNKKIGIRFNLTNIYFVNYIIAKHLKTSSKTHLM